MISLQDKKVLVVGGSSGIGLATAKAAAAAGARVTIASRSADRLAAAVKDIGAGADSRQLDQTNDTSVEKFFSDGQEWDGIVMSAGAGGRGVPSEISMDTAFAAMNGKFWGYYRVARAAKITSGGSLTFISGALSNNPAPGASLISAINAAIEGLTLGLAIDFAPTRVNTVCPGIVDTALWEQLSDDARKAMYENARARLPARKVGEPDEVAQAILYFMTNAFSTGTVLHLDGGAKLL